MAVDNVDSLANDYAASRPPYLTYKLSLYSADFASSFIKSVRSDVKLYKGYHWILSTTPILRNLFTMRPVNSQGT